MKLVNQKQDNLFIFR